MNDESLIKELVVHHVSTGDIILISIDMKGLNIQDQIRIIKKTEGTVSARFPDLRFMVLPKGEADVSVIRKVEDKYSPIKKMSNEDRKDVLDFALERSEEILTGEDDDE